MNNRGRDQRSTAAAAATPTRVRMYCGTPDAPTHCFLISTGTGDGAVHVLVDCGVEGPANRAAPVARRIAEDVERATGGRVDVAIVTQAHWGHVSGFLHARDVFDRIERRQVWLPWTQNPNDATATRVREATRQAARGLRVAARRLWTAGNEKARRQLAAALGRFGATESGPGPDDAIERLLRPRAARPPRVSYLSAGETGMSGGPSGSSHALRVHALAPGRAPAAAPAAPGKHAATALGLAPDVDAYATLRSRADGEDVDPDRDRQSQAFEFRYRVPLEDAQAQPFFEKRYFNPKRAWRAIGADWLLCARQLALDLDDCGAAGGLGLAIELEPGGRIILLPGDAPAARWACPAGSSAEDLLSRAAVYVPGRAGPTYPAGETPAAGAVALVPFRDSGPAPARARGRVVRPDRPRPVQPRDVPDDEWHAFNDRVVVNEEPSYVDYALPE